MPQYTAYSELPRRALVLTMIGVMTSLFMAALDQTVVGTAMPRIVADLRGFEHYSGVVTAYMVSSTTVVPIVGKLSDLYGRKRFLLAGVTIFVFASLLCGAAQSMEQLVAFRALQGLGAGFTQSMAFTTVADLFPPSQRGRIAGVLGGVFGLASIVGPAVGGLLTDGPGWRMVFYLNLPIGIAAIAVLATTFPDIRVPRNKRPVLDLAGAALLVIAIVPLLLGLSWGGREHPWSSPTILGLLGAGCAAIALFFVVELRAAEPILPLGLLKNPVVTASLVAGALLSVGMLGTMLFIPLFLQAVLGASASRSGAVLVPMTLAMIVATGGAGQMISRRGRYRSVGVFGVGVSALGMLLVSRMTPSTSFGEVVASLVVLGVGLGATMPVFTLAAQNAVDIRVVGSVTSTVQFSRSVGGTLGVAIFGALLANRFVPVMHAALPAGMMDRLPPKLVEQLDNPQILMSSLSAARVREGLVAALGADAERGTEQIFAAVKQALAVGLHEVFLVAALLLVVATAAAAVVKDIPLRTSNRVADDEEPGAATPA